MKPSTAPLTPQAESQWRKRVRRRRGQRGNTLFIVVMVISLMTAVGVVSMRAASMAEQATGYDRQGVQAGYISEFAAKSVMSELVGKEQLYFSYIATGRDDCRANQKLAAMIAPNRPSCYRLESQEMWSRFNAVFPGNVGSSKTELFGTLGRGETEAAFIVEMTDLARAGGPIAGEDVAMDQFRFMQVLLTATAQVRPRIDTSGSSSTTCNDSLSKTSGLETLRAQVTFGPVN
jgi:hypothetical protein